MREPSACVRARGRPRRRGGASERLVVVATDTHTSQQPHQCAALFFPNARMEGTALVGGGAPRANAQTKMNQASRTQLMYTHSTATCSQRASKSVSRLAHTRE